MVKHAKFDAEENQKKIDSSGVSKSMEYVKKFVNSHFDIVKLTISVHFRLFQSFLDLN